MSILKKIMSLETQNDTLINKFQIKYSNNFCKLAINKLLKSLEDEIENIYDYTRGTGAGTNFENKIIKTILYSHNNIF